MSPEGGGASVARAVEERSYSCVVVGDMGSPLVRPLCGGWLRAVDSLLTKPPDTTGGQRHEFSVGRVIPDRLPPGQDGGSHFINPLVRNWSDHVRAAELAAHRELDYKISFLGVTFHLEPIAVVRDPERQVRPAPRPRRHRVPHDA